MSLNTRITVEYSGGEVGTLTALYELQAGSLSAIINLIYSDDEFISRTIERLEIPSVIDGFEVTGISRNIFNETAIAMYFNGNDDEPIIVAGTERFRIKNLIIPDCVRHIEETAFEYVYVDNVRWPASCTKILDSTFAGSTLETLTNVENVKLIDNSAFERCGYLESTPDFPNCKSIGFAAFSACRNLERFRWPAKCKAIPADCFRMSCKLSEVTNLADVEEIGMDAFSNTGVKSFTVGKKCKTVGMYAFKGCVHLKKVDWNHNTADISASCFSNCCDLEEIANIENVTQIGQLAFDNTGLKEFIWPEGCSNIPYGCFSESLHLESVVLPKAIKIVEDRAFYGTKIKELDFSDADLTLEISAAAAPVGCDVKIPFYATLVEEESYEDVPF